MEKQSRQHRWRSGSLAAKATDSKDIETTVENMAPRGKTDGKQKAKLDIKTTKAKAARIPKAKVNTQNPKAKVPTKEKAKEKERIPKGRNDRRP